MRYYSIQLPSKTYTSLASDGSSQPGALNVEMDVGVVPFATPMGDSFVRVWGISLQEISQATNLNGSAISVFGGMQKGLPLANPAQAGLLAQGYVLQAFGNWVGKDMSLDLILTASPTKTDPVNLSFNWKKGSTLASAIASTLSSAYPSFKQNINISPNLVLANDEPGVYQNLTQLAQYIKQRSIAIVGGTYGGVDISLNGSTFNVYDGTTQGTPKQLAFQDFVGQPTWINPTSVQSKFIMRSDIKVGDFVKFPATPVISQSNTVSPLVNQKLTFQGVFQVTQVRHVGNFRQSDGESWVTVVDAAATAPVAAT